MVRLEKYSLQEFWGFLFGFHCSGFGVWVLGLDECEILRCLFGEK